MINQVKYADTWTENKAIVEKLNQVLNRKSTFLGKKIDATWCI